MKVIGVVLLSFWALSVLTIFISYILYPLSVMFFCGGKTDQWSGTGEFPHISILVVGKNEEKNIQRKLKNLLSLDYPKDKMEIIVVSDGSSDKMVEKAYKFLKDYLEIKSKVLDIKENIGINEAFAKGVESSSYDIIVFTDSNSFLHRKALRKLVMPLKDSQIALTNGLIEFTDPEKLDVTEGYRSYWSVEKKIKKAESNCGISCVITGAISAIKKDIFLPVKSEFSSDMIMPLWVSSKGFKTLFVNEAVLFSPQRREKKADFKRRVRVALRGLYTFSWMLKNIPITKTNYKNYLALFLHKVLRWVSLSFLGITFILSLIMMPLEFRQGGFVEFLGIFSAIYFISLIFLQGIMRITKGNRYVKIIYYLNLLLWASTVAVFQLIRGVKIKTWEPDKG